MAFTPNAQSLIAGMSMLPFKIMGHCVQESLFSDLIFLMINSGNILIVCNYENTAISLKFYPTLRWFGTLWLDWLCLQSHLLCQTAIAAREVCTATAFTKTSTALRLGTEGAIRRSYDLPHLIGKGHRSHQIDCRTFPQSNAPFVLQSCYYFWSHGPCGTEIFL